MADGILKIDNAYLSDLQGRLKSLYERLSSSYDEVGRLRYGADTSALGSGALAGACDDYLVAWLAVLRLCGQLTDGMARSTADTQSTMAQIDARLNDVLGPGGPEVDVPSTPIEELVWAALDHVVPVGKHHGSWKSSSGGYVGRRRRSRHSLFRRR